MLKRCTKNKSAPAAAASADCDWLEPTESEDDTCWKKKKKKTHIRNEHIDKIQDEQTMNLM